MSEIIQDKVNQINCLNEEIDSLYHQAALKLGVSDCVLFVLYMLHTNDDHWALPVRRFVTRAQSPAA